MRMGAPQQAHRNGGRGFIQVGPGSGATFSAICSSAIRRLLFGCRKPKLRDRRKPLGSTCCRSSDRKRAPLTVRTALLPVWLQMQLVLLVEVR